MVRTVGLMRGTSADQPGRDSAADRNAAAGSLSVGDALSLSAAHGRGMHIVSRTACWQCQRVAAGRATSGSAVSATSPARANEVLVVANDADLGSVLLDLLAERGHRGMLMTNGDDAGQWRPCPSLALVEVTPRADRDGPSLLHRLTSDPSLRSVPVLLYGTDRARLAQMVEARRATGRVAALSMPFEIEAFFEAIDRLAAAGAP